MYSQWKADPTSVDASWQKHFQNAEGGAVGTAAGAQQDIGAIIEALKGAGFVQGATGQGAAVDSGAVMKNQADAAKLATYIRAFMTHGHMFADLDPLKLEEVYDE